MSLKETLLQDMKDSLKQKDTLRKDVVQIIRAGILQIEKDSKTLLDDAGILNIISKEVKKRVDVLPDFEKGGRADLVQTVNRELEILKAYLPEQLSQSEISQIINDTKEEIGATNIKDMGKLMQAVTPKFSGRADNKLVSELVKAALSN